jgi:centromeric protein E
MDVSRVDPEEVLVDAQNVEPADVSGEVDESLLPGRDHGKEDKVLVSIRYILTTHSFYYFFFFLKHSIYRIRPTNTTCAWAKAGQTIKLQSDYSKSATGAAEYNFDEILTGSENKPVYNAVARSHVCAAMDGYNAVIFAYGQTASGKTFTLVSSR